MMIRSISQKSKRGNFISHLADSVRQILDQVFGFDDLKVIYVDLAPGLCIFKLRSFNNFGHKNKDHGLEHNIAKKLFALLEGGRHQCQT